MKRCFGRIYNAIETMTCTKYEGVSENKEKIIYGFKNVKRDKVDNYILFGCQSDELFEYDKLFIFWSGKFINEEIQKRDTR